MIDFLKFVFSNFWSWLGFVLVFGMILNFLFKLYNRPFRHANIRKHGYPPPYCDADGTLIKQQEENQE